MPKATDHIQEMIDLTETLIEREHAYVVDTGSVYFDVTSFPGYGRLSGNTLDKLKAGSPGPRDRSREAPPGRLRALEGRRARGA